MQCTLHHMGCRSRKEKGIGGRRVKGGGGGQVGGAGVGFVIGRRGWDEGERRGEGNSCAPRGRRERGRRRGEEEKIRGGRGTSTEKILSEA